jgi:hypothetical protein
MGLGHHRGRREKTALQNHGFPAQPLFSPELREDQRLHPRDFGGPGFSSELTDVDGGGQLGTQTSQQNRRKGIKFHDRAGLQR